MKLSAKTRYGIAALTYLHLQESEVTPLVSIAKHLNISKIYMEQVFSNLKNAGIVDAIKGSSGGYYLVNDDHNMFDVLNSLEPGLFKVTPSSTDDERINNALHTFLYEPVDTELQVMLKGIYLKDIAKSIKESDKDSLMYYI